MRRRTLLGLLGAAGAGGAAGGLSGATTDADATATGGENASDGAKSNTTDASTDEREHPQERSDGKQCPDGLVTHECRGSVDEAVERITAAVEASPLTLVETIDHAANAASVDEELPPTTLLVFGNPEVGTPLMSEERTVAIDLPQKLLVWEDGDALKVTYNDPRYLARRHGIEEMDERVEQIVTVLENLAKSAWPSEDG